MCARLQAEMAAEAARVAAAYVQTGTHTGGYTGGGQKPALPRPAAVAQAAGEYPAPKPPPPRPALVQQMVDELQVASLGSSGSSGPWASHCTSWEQEAAALRHYTPPPKPPVPTGGSNQPTPTPSAAWLGGGVSP